MLVHALIASVPRPLPHSIATRRRWRASTAALAPSTQSAPFPGEDAPGTGRRHFPSLENREDTSVTSTIVDKHHQRSTQECYAAFPSLVHTSCPLTVTDTVPSGYAIRHEPDAGPKSGKRQPPAVYNTEPPALDPVHSETVEARLRELKLRRSC